MLETSQKLWKKPCYYNSNVFSKLKNISETSPPKKFILKILLWWLPRDCASFLASCSWTGCSFVCRSWTKVLASSRRSDWVPTRTTGTFPQLARTSGIHFSLHNNYFIIWIKNHQLNNLINRAPSLFITVDLVHSNILKRNI